MARSPVSGELAAGVEWLRWGPWPQGAVGRTVSAAVVRCWEVRALATDDASDLGRRRLWAVAALVCGALALLAVLLFTLDSVGNLVLAVAGAAVAVTGGWFFAAHRGIRRGLAAAVSVVGVVMAVLGLLWAGRLITLVVAGVLVAMSVTSAGLATRNRPGLTTAANLAAPVPAAQHPVLLMNPWSGGGKVGRFGLERACRDRGIEPVVLTEGDDLVQLAEAAIARGADVIGMAGGDGSQALVATVAMRHGVPHVVVPAGTRNHLALDLGLDRDDVVGALDAFAGGIPRTVDLASVNGRVFVNNVSLGLYADIVSSQAYRDAKLRTALDTLPDLLGPDADTLDLQFVDGTGVAHDTADVVLVSNNPYALRTLGGVGTRARLDSGALGVVSLTLTSAADARRFLALEGAGLVDRFSGWQQWSTPRFEVRSGGPLALGVDGEALTMDPPLVFESISAAVVMLLPPHAPGRSPAARAVTPNTVVELWNLASGRT